jgi:hypothetical protein
MGDVIGGEDKFKHNNPDFADDVVDVSEAGGPAGELAALRGSNPLITRLGESLMSKAWLEHVGERNPYQQAEYDRLLEQIAALRAKLGDHKDDSGPPDLPQGSPPAA